MLGLLILVVLMMWLTSRSDCHTQLCPTQACHTDAFLGEMPNSDSHENDYFHDNTGLKGTLFRPMPNTPKYNILDKKEIVLPEARVIKYLEIYPEKFYVKCQAASEYSDLTLDTPY